MNHLNHLTRREFLQYATGLGVSASCLALLSACGIQPVAPTTEPPLETTTIKLAHNPTICFAPQYFAEELLKAEGFTNVRYIKSIPGAPLRDAMASDQIDMSMLPVATHITNVDAGAPLVALAGIHPGCYELFGSDQISSIRDLKTVAISTPGNGVQILLSSMFAYVGIEPKDIHWVTYSFDEMQQLLIEGKIDGWMAFPPEPQELRAKKVGHVILNTMMDKPWSQYFCCELSANHEFVRKNPVATKRALRAILKATEVCTREPEQVAQYIVDKGLASDYDYTLQMLYEMQSMGAYNTWRVLDPEDTLRFYALRLNEVELIKSSPNDIIARSADWRYLNELKTELQGFVAAPTSTFYCRVS